MNRALVTLVDVHDLREETGQVRRHKIVKSAQLLREDGRRIKRIRPANDGSLTPRMNFWQAGGQIGGVLIFKDGALDGLNFPIDYTYLQGISGPFKSVELLQVAANYTIPKTKYVTIGLSYTSGRNLDTFERQKIYKATLGLKY